jgi:hypothetical protein
MRGAEVQLRFRVTPVLTVHRPDGEAPLMGDTTSIFAIPPDAVSPAEVEYYYTMEVPGPGLVEGQWDLRGIVDKYLGNVSFAGKRVLEIGPAFRLPDHRNGEARRQRGSDRSS